MNSSTTDVTKPGNRRLARSPSTSKSSTTANGGIRDSATTATQQVLALPLQANVLPFSNLGAPTITDVSLYLKLNQAPAAGTAIAASFGPTGGTTSALSIVQVPGNTGGGTAIAAIGADAGLTGPLSPGSFALTVPEASVPAALGVTSNGHLRLDSSKFEDIVLIVSYKVV